MRGILFMAGLAGSFGLCSILREPEGVDTGAGGKTPAATVTMSPDELRKMLAERDGELTKAIEGARAEIAKVGTVGNETAAQLEVVSKDHRALTEAMRLVEQNLATAKAGGLGVPAVKSFGEVFAQSEAFQQAKAAGRADQTGKISVGKQWFGAAAILNATGQNQPLVPDMRVPGVMTGPERVFTIRDLLSQGTTVSNLVQYVRELVFTNAAGPQYDGSSPSPSTEGAIKPESGMTFELVNAPVVTVAHWLPASRQILDDAPYLESYIDGRMRYGLKLEEERQLLNGDGTQGGINGLMNQATAFNRSGSADTALDTLRKAILQAMIADYPVDGIVLNPREWAGIELAKDGESRYIIGDPRAILGPQVWGKRVAETNAQTAAQFLVGAFQLGAQLWDRMEATVEIARQHADFFIRNMVVVLCEERIALTVYRPAAFIKGALGGGV